MKQDPTPTIARIQAEIEAWRCEQFPDCPLDVSLLKIKEELAEFEYARAAYLWRRSPRHAQQLVSEAVGVMVTLLADLSALPIPQHHDNLGAYFAAAFGDIWGEVSERDYRSDQ